MHKIYIHNVLYLNFLRYKNSVKWTQSELYKLNFINNIEDIC